MMHSVTVVNRPGYSVDAMSDDGHVWWLEMVNGADSRVSERDYRSSDAALRAYARGKVVWVKQAPPHSWDGWSDLDRD